MSRPGKDSVPQTTIWQKSSGGQSLVDTLPGLPYGVLQMGQVVHIKNYGEASCCGISKTGSGANEAITEIKLLLK
jgi:hypothetical protein